MLNKNQERELCYVVKVDEVRPIPGRDRVECAVVGGWTCMVPKDAFKAGDLGIYFEIDSKVDTSKEVFAFTEKYHGKIKTQKFKTPEGHFYSQGLLMSAKDFGWIYTGEDFVTDNNKVFRLGDFLTKELGVTYAVEEDNKRKAKSNPDAKYQRMMNRHPKLAKSKFGRWCMKHTWAKKLLFLLLGNKYDKSKTWPEWVVKTDEERVQNLTHMLEEYSKEEWIATEKVDGTSTTFTMKRAKHPEMLVCSRNVCFNIPGKAESCYYDTNVYLEMAKKYNMETVLKGLLVKYPEADFITIQGETYGAGIQRREYSIKDHDLAVFNVIIGTKEGTVRLNPFEGAQLMAEYRVPYVPIIGRVTLPASCEGILALAGGESYYDNLAREGLVFRSLDGSKSFKAVDNEFLLKYHN